MDNKEFKKTLSDALKKDKVILGEKKVLKSLKEGKGKVVSFATNCREKENVLSLAKKKEIDVYAYPGSNMELGELCKKPFSVSVLLIL